MGKMTQVFLDSSYEFGMGVIYDPSPRGCEWIDRSFLPELFCEEVRTAVACSIRDRLMDSPGRCPVSSHLQLCFLSVRDNEDCLWRDGVLTSWGVAVGRGGGGLLVRRKSRRTSWS